MDKHRSKTVIILDRSSYFCRQSGVTFNVVPSTNEQQKQDETNNENTSGIKSLWTCVIEAVLEYCRILFDIFENDALVTLIVTGIDQRDQSLWWSRYKNLTQCMDFFAGVMPPSERQSSNEDDLLKYSINEAITALCTRSIKQTGTNNFDYENDGNIIIFSNFQNAKKIESVERDVRNFHELHNHMALEVTDFVPLTKCSLSLIDVLPLDNNDKIQTSNTQSHKITSILTRTIYYAKAGQSLFTKTLQMILAQHNLALTTVTGIPMKEDVASRSSLNYDVDIVHPAEVHDILRDMGALKYWRQIKDDVETIVLKWSAFSYDPENYYDTYSAYRFSPLDVNSRESVCLTNFLLSGKCVLLELGQLPQECTINIRDHSLSNYSNLKEEDINQSGSTTTSGGSGTDEASSNSRLFSHMIISHNHELYIHAIAFGQNQMSKIAPWYSITEDSNNQQQRLQMSSYDQDDFDDIDDDIIEKDLRVESFIEIMHATTLYPVESTLHGKIPIEDSLRLLERHTRQWPLLTNETILYHMSPPVNILTTVLLRERLTEDDRTRCLVALKHVEDMEKSGEQLPIPANFQYFTKLSTTKAKKDEQYRFLWKEIECFLRSHKDNSDIHRQIYQHVLERKKIDTDNDVSLYPSNTGDFLLPMDTTSNIKDKGNDVENSAANNDNVQTWGRTWSELSDIKQVLAANSLRDIWNRKQQEKRAPEFDARAEHPLGIIPLYVNLETSVAANSTTTTATTITATATPLKEIE